MSNESTLETWELTVLTPLHVGDGQTLEPGVDFIRQGRELHVYNIESICRAAEAIPKAMTGYGSASFDLKRLIADHRLAVVPRYVLPLQSQMEAKEIRCFIKDADGRPYLPGSTVKGAIRTALWQGLDRSGLPRPSQDRKAFKNYEKAVNAVSGKNPHQDFLRPLSVSDSHPVDPQDSLRADEIKFFNILYDNRPGWKNFADRRSVPNWNQAQGVLVEAVKPEQSFLLSVSLDGFLREEKIQRCAQLPYCRDLSSFDTLTEAVNRQSLALAQAEKAFFKSFGAETARVHQAYQGICEGIGQALQNGDHFFLRVAWGGGWRAMTGNWIGKDDLSIIRSVKSRMGKPQFDIFPKTRRLAMDSVAPCLPLGWMLVKRLPGDVFRKHTPTFCLHVGISDEALSFSTTQPTEPVEQEKQGTAIKSSLAAANDRLDRFSMSLAACRNLPGEANRFLDAIQSQDDPMIRKQMAKMLLNQAKGLSGFKKAKKTGKRWAVEIEKLGDELSA